MVYRVFLKKSIGFRVWGLGFRVQGLGFGVFGFGVLGLRISVDKCEFQPKRSAYVNRRARLRRTSN